jgi:hypothetical protein
MPPPPPSRARSHTPPGSLHRRCKGAISAIRRSLPPQMPPWMVGAADFASIPLGPLRAQPAACPRMADPPPPPPTSTRQHPILAQPPPRTRKPSFPRPLHRSPSPSDPPCKSDPHARSASPRLLYLYPTTREIGIAAPRRPPPKWRAVSARGHLFSLSLPLLHSGVLVKQRRWLGLLLMFLRGCVQGFTKSLAMTVLSEIGDKTFFPAAVCLLPPSPHVTSPALPPVLLLAFPASSCVRRCPV